VVKFRILIFHKSYFIRLIILILLACCFTLGLNQMVNAKHKDAIQAISPVLLNKVVVVDPGHGGVDPGAVGKNNGREKDIVLDVGRRLATFLAQGGTKVIMTRETDTDLSDPELCGLLAKKRQDLARRVALARDNQADVYVSIHTNSSPDASRKGTYTFFRVKEPESKKLAQTIQNELAFGLKFGLKEEGKAPLTGDFYILRESKIPTVIVEIGFLSNPREAKLLTDPAYQTKIAWCIYAGLVRYFAGPTPGQPASSAVSRQAAVVRINQD